MALNRRDARSALNQEARRAFSAGTSGDGLASELAKDRPVQAARAQKRVAINVAKRAKRRGENVNVKDVRAQARNVTTQARGAKIAARNQAKIAGRTQRQEQSVKSGVEKLRRKKSPVLT